MSRMIEQSDLLVKNRRKYHNDRRLLALDGYKPYEGPSGPSEEQTHNNNLALEAALGFWGFEPAWSTLNRELGLGVDPDEEVVMFKLHGEELCCSYDRWGYVIDGNDDADQISLDKVILWMMEQLLMG